MHKTDKLVEIENAIRFEVNIHPEDGMVHPIVSNLILVMAAIKTLRQKEAVPPEVLLRIRQLKAGIDDADKRFAAAGSPGGISIVNDYTHWLFDQFERLHPINE